MNLLQIYDESIVSKTTLSRKLTLGGVTKAYPVYRVRLDQLFYMIKMTELQLGLHSTKMIQAIYPFQNCHTRITIK